MCWASTHTKCLESSNAIPGRSPGAQSLPEAMAKPSVSLCDPSAPHRRPRIHYVQCSVMTGLTNSSLLAATRSGFVPYLRSKAVQKSV